MISLRSGLARNLCATVTVAGLMVTFLVGCPKTSPSRTGDNGATAANRAIKLGISPYPDTGLPVMAEKQGFLKQNRLDADLKILQWGEVMPAVASGSVDAVIQNFNSFHEVYGNLKSKGVDLVFYRPLFVFKGGGLMARGGSGLVSFRDMLRRFPNRAEAVRQTFRQLRGKTIITPQGTDHEQMVLAGLKLAGLNPQSDVKIRHAEGDNGVAAFVGGEGDVCSSGLVQRLAVERHGGFLFIEMDEVIPPVINGIITTRSYAQVHSEELDRLTAAWFQTVQYMDADPKERSKPFLEFLSGQGSAKFTPEQYVDVWRNGDVFPKTPQEADTLFNVPTSKYYWKNSWNSIGSFLVASRKIKTAAPEAAYLARK